MDGKFFPDLSQYLSYFSIMCSKDIKIEDFLTRKGRLSWCISDIIKRSNGKLKYQKDVAASMKVRPATMSRAVNGEEAVLTDRFLIKFNRAFNFRYSLAWLIDGTGEPLASAEPDSDSYSGKDYLPSSDATHSAIRDDSDVTANVTDGIAQDPLVLHLLAELKQRDHRIATLESQLSFIVERISSGLNDLSSRLDDIASRLPLK